MRPRAKSGSWFKRKSGMFMLNGGADLDVVTEDRPVTKQSAKRETEDNSTVYSKEDDSPVHSPVVHSPAPLLPEIGNLSTGASTGGDLGWDEAMFKR